MHSNYFKFSSLNPIIVICLSIFPPSLITGPLIPEILIFLINILFIINLKKIKISQQEKKILFFLLLWWLFLVLRSLFSTEIFLSSKATIFYFRYILFAAAIYFFYLKNISSIKYLAYSIIFCFLILIIDSSFQFFLGKNILGYTKYGLIGNYEVIRLGSLFGDELILGSYLSKFFPYIILIIFFLKDFRNKIFLFIICPLAIFTIFLSGERQAFYSTVIFLILLFPILNKKNIFVFLNLVFFSFILIYFITFFNSNITKRMFYPIKNIQILVNNYIFKDTSNNINNLDNDSSEFSVENIKNLNNLIIFSPQHTSHFKVAMAMFEDNIYFGKGPNSFRKLCLDEKYKIYLPKNQNGCSTHPHNFYLQNLAETGIIGFFVIFYFFVFVVIKYLLIIYNNIFNASIHSVLNYPKIIMYAHIIVLLNPLMTNGNFFNNYLNILHFYIFSLNFIIINNSRLVQKLLDKKFKFF